MANKIRYTVLSFACIFLLIFAGFGLVVGQIIHLQTSEKEKQKWGAIADSQIKTNQPIYPRRGNILDANGYVLASSLPQFAIRMDTRVEALHQKNDSLFNKYVDSIAIGLSQIIGDNRPQEYKKKMVNAFNSKKIVRGKEVKGKDIRLYGGRISYVQKKQIQQLPLIRDGIYKSGVYFKELHIREKPFAPLGSRTIGSIYGEAGYGNVGLEKSFEEYLRGKEGISTRMRVAGKWANIPVLEAEDGCDIVTSLDVNLMDICESILRDTLDRLQADWGCVILMETHSGQIKAICNLDRNKDGSYSENMNHAVIQVEPGSTFKTIAMMAALDDGKIQIDDTFYVHRKGWDYRTSHHTDSHPRDTFYTARSALAISSNIALAKMIVKSYEGKAEQFIAKLDKMGMRKGFDTEIPGTMPPKINVPKDAVTISKMAYGYSVELSPMQIVAFYNGIANGGQMIKPYIVTRIEKKGEVVKAFDTETLNASLCKSSTLKDIQGALHDVVWDSVLPGTASNFYYAGRLIRRKAQSNLVHIAGKTGTAQLLYPNEHGRYRYNRYMHRITFVGYFPEEDPQYTCLCMIEHPRPYGSYDAGFHCGGIVRQIAERTMAYSWVYEIQDGQIIFKKR